MPTMYLLNCKSYFIRARRSLKRPISSRKYTTTDVALTIYSIQYPIQRHNPTLLLAQSLLYRILREVSSKWR